MRFTRYTRLHNVETRVRNCVLNGFILLYVVCKRIITLYSKYRIFTEINTRTFCFTVYKTSVLYKTRLEFFQYGLYAYFTSRLNIPLRAIRQLIVVKKCIFIEMYIIVRQMFKKTAAFVKCSPRIDSSPMPFIPTLTFNKSIANNRYSFF